MFSHFLSCSVAAVSAMTFTAFASPPAASRELKVCADPNNMPFSNDRAEGFENRVSQLVATELGATVKFVWMPEWRGFVRMACDVDVALSVGACRRLLRGAPDPTVAGHAGRWKRPYVVLNFDGRSQAGCRSCRRDRSRSREATGGHPKHPCGLPRAILSGTEIRNRGVSVVKSALSVLLWAHARGVCLRMRALKERKSSQSGNSLSDQRRAEGRPRAIRAGQTEASRRSERYGPAADGQQLDLRRLDREHRGQHSRRTPERHARLPRLFARRANLAARRLPRSLSHPASNDTAAQDEKK